MRAFSQTAELFFLKSVQTDFFSHAAAFCTNVVTFVANEFVLQMSLSRLFQCCANGKAIEMQVVTAHLILLLVLPLVATSLYTNSSMADEIFALPGAYFVYKFKQYSGFLKGENSNFLHYW